MSINYFATVNGLIREPNQLLAPDWQKTREIIFIVDKNNETEINNIVDYYRGREFVKLPILYLNGDMVIKIHTIKVISHLDREILKVPQDQWKNQRFKCKFQLEKYTFPSRLKNNNGKLIHGIKFKLVELAIFALCQ